MHTKQTVTLARATNIAEEVAQAQGVTVHITVNQWGPGQVKVRLPGFVGYALTVPRRDGLRAVGETTWGPLSPEVKAFVQAFDDALVAESAL